MRHVANYPVFCSQQHLFKCMGHIENLQISISPHVAKPPGFPTHRARQREREETLVRQKHQSEAEYRGLVNRQRIMREFRERQLHCIEILPAGRLLLSPTFDT